MFIYNVVITIVSLYYKKSSPFDTIEISIKCLPFFCVKNWLTCIQVIGLLIYNVYQNREPLTTADSTANVSTADVTTANMLVLGYGLWVRVWVRP